MSHAASCKVKMTDLDVLVDAFKRLGGRVVKKPTHGWYGTWVDDTIIPYGIFSDAETDRLRASTREERKAVMQSIMGKCDMAVEFDGTRYEVGIVKREDGTYRLQWDYFDGVMNSKMGDGSKIAQAYQVEAAKKAAKKNNYIVHETKLTNGKVKLELVARY